jgi:methyl-accepting chemotaxis protein
MLRTRSLSARILVSVLAVLIASLAAVTLLVTRRTTELATDSAHETARATAEGRAAYVEEQLAASMQTAADVAASLEALVKAGSGRGDARSIMRVFLERNEDAFGIWAGFEPDAFDLFDEGALLGETRAADTDDTGRFLPYWRRGADGEPVLEALRDYEDPVLGAYYVDSRDSGLPNVTEPYFYDIDGVPTLMTSVAVPIFVDTGLRGVAGVDLLLSSLQAGMSDLTVMDGAGFLSLVSSDGLVVTHPDASLLGQAAPPALAEQSSAALAAGVPVGADVSDAVFGGDAYVVAIPFEVAPGDTWTVVASVPTSVMVADVNALRNQLVLVALVVLVAAALIVVAVARRLSAKVGVAATEVEASAERLTAVSDAMGVASGRTAEQAGVVSAASEEVTVTVTSVAGAVEELSASVREIAASAAQVSERAQVAQHAVNDAGDTVAELDRSSAEIGEVLALIEGLARQTHMLALNATIEAARAGEAGRGFAVVADEVKTLASETAKATENIAQRISAIQADSARVTEVFDELSMVMTAITDAQTTIASAVEQQNASTQDIAASLAQAAAGTQEIARGMSDVANAADASARESEVCRAAAHDLTRVADGLQQLVRGVRTDGAPTWDGPVVDGAAVVADAPPAPVTDGDGDAVPTPELVAVGVATAVADPGAVTGWTWTEPAAEHGDDVEDVDASAEQDASWPSATWDDLEAAVPSEGATHLDDVDTTDDDDEDAAGA